MLALPPAAYSMGTADAYSSNGIVYPANGADLVITNFASGTNCGTYAAKGTNMIIYYQDFGLTQLAYDYYVITNANLHITFVTNYVSSILLGDKTNIFYAGFTWATNVFFRDWREGWNGGSGPPKAVQAVHERFGRLDILVNNAGGPAKGGRLEELSLEAFDTAIAVHVRGALAHMKYAAPIMRGQRSGSIVNIGSIAGHRAGYSSSVIYATAKAALIHLSRCAAMELGEDGVRVNSISPGAIATGIFGKAMGLDHTEADKTAERIKVPFASMQAIPRSGIVDDIANAAVFLASDEAGFITAEDLVIDGGVIWGRRFSEPAPGVAAMRKLLAEG